MQPDYVLSHEEKRKRFQRTRAKTMDGASDSTKLLIPLNYEDSDPETPDSSSFSSPKSHYDASLTQFEDLNSPAPWRNYDSPYMTSGSNSSGYGSFKSEAPNANLKSATVSSMSLEGGKESSYSSSSMWPANYGYNDNFSNQDKQDDSDAILKQLGIAVSKTPNSLIDQTDPKVDPFSSPVWGSSTNSEEDLAQVAISTTFADPAKALQAVTSSGKSKKTTTTTTLANPVANPERSFLDEFMASHEVASCDKHSSGKPHSNAKTVLIQALRDNVGEFVDTAVKAKIKFKDKEDWSALFKQNKRLMINFVLSRFLTGLDRKQQRLWLCSKNTCCGCSMSSIGFSDVNAFINEGVELFGSDKVMQDVYMGFAKSLGNLKVEPVHKAQLFTMLFYYQGSLPLNNSLAACREFLGTIQQLNQTNGCSLPLHEAYEAGRTLEAMSVLFEHSGLAGKNIPEYSEDYGPESALLNFGFSDEETNWLAEQKDATIQALLSVPIGTELSKQLLDYSWNHGDLPRSFGPACSRIHKERFWRLYSRFDEFKSLSDTDQASIVLSSLHLYCALMTAMTDDAPIVDLVKFGISMSEIEQDPNLRFILEASPEQQAKLRPLSLKKMVPNLPSDFAECVESIQSVIRRGDNGYMNFFAILTAVIFDPIAIGCKTSKAKRERWQGLLGLSKRFRVALARQYGAEWENFEFRIRSTLLDLRILASMVNPNDVDIEHISAAAYGRK